MMYEIQHNGVKCIVYIIEDVNDEEKICSDYSKRDTHINKVFM